MNKKILGTASAFALALSFTTTTAFAANNTPIYMLSSHSEVQLKVLATAGDKIGGNLIKGIPDGMGAHKTSTGALQLFSVFEHSTSAAKARESLSSPWGASITTFTYNPRLKFFRDADNNFIKTINFWNYKEGKWTLNPVGSGPSDAPAGTFGWGLSRFCSANLVPAGTLAFNDNGKKIGYDGALFFTGEESGDASRGFVFEMDGTGYQFPGIGMASWENLLTNPKPGKNTVILANEDGSATNSHIKLWVGQKQATGNAFEKAGLANGKLYVLNVPAAANDNVFRTTIGKNKKTAVDFKEVNWNQTVADFDKSVTAAGSEFARVEDGEWDPNDPNVYYFLTTESNKDPVATAPNPALPGVSRDGGALWRLTFKDAQNPLLGAELEMLLNGGESMYLSKPDNLAVTKSGVIMIQEDPGNNDALSRIVAYRIKDGAMATVAQFDPMYFTKTGAKFMTIDEESSGIIDITDQVKGKNDKNTYFLFNAQVHTSGVMAARPDMVRSPAKQKELNTAALEGGQYYLMTVGDWNSIFRR
jgi:hypothetical protein